MKLAASPTLQSHDTLLLQPDTCRCVPRTTNQRTKLTSCQCTH